MPETPKRNILLIGSYGRGNIGDDAFLLAALKLFKGHNLFINSANDSLLPKSVRGKVTTIATDSSKGLMRKLQVFMSIRHIVYCGGDVWVELYGDRYPRQSLYKMLIVNLVARLFGKRVHYVGVGIGRLQGYSLFLARLSARLANTIIVREPRSASVLDLKKVHVLPDLVTNLDVEPATKKHHGKYVIGVSILYYLPEPQKNFPKLLKTLRDVFASMPSDQFKIVLFPMLASPADEHDDVWASGQLEAMLPDADISIFGGREVDEYIQALQEVDVLVGTRLHANIIALLAGVPALGISYRPKVAQFFGMNGLGEYCMGLNDLTTGKLTSKLSNMLNRREHVRADFRHARERNIAERKGYQSFVDQL